MSLTGLKRGTGTACSPYGLMLLMFAVLAPFFFVFSLALFVFVATEVFSLVSFGYDLYSWDRGLITPFDVDVEIHAGSCKSRCGCCKETG